MKYFISTILFLAFQVQAGSIDLKQSSLSWKGTKVSGKHVGKISLKKADLQLDKNGRIQQANLTVGMNSVTVTDLQGEWAKKFLDHIKGTDFLEIKKYPEAKLVINKDDGKFLYGKLTIKGKTNPVKMKYKKAGKVYSGTLEFNRTKFNMKYGSGSFFKGLGDKMIHDKVTLDFKIVTGQSTPKVSLR